MPLASTGISGGLNKLTEGCFYVFTQAGDEADRLGKPWVNERILESRLAEIRHFG